MAILRRGLPALLMIVTLLGLLPAIHGAAAATLAAADALEIQSRVLSDGSPAPYASVATYEIRLRHHGGSQPIQAQVRDVLPSSLRFALVFDESGSIIYADSFTTTSTGGVAPLQAGLSYDARDSSVGWQGALAPNAELTLSFRAYIRPPCAPGQQTSVITNIAQGQPVSGSSIRAAATLTAACPAGSASMTPPAARLSQAQPR